MNAEDVAKIRDLVATGDADLLDSSDWTEVLDALDEAKRQRDHARLVLRRIRKTPCDCCDAADVAHNALAAGHEPPTVPPATDTTATAPTRDR